MEKENKCKIWIETDPSTEECMFNQFDELILLALCRVYRDKEKKKEIEPLCCMTTQDEGGTERHFYFSQRKLSILISQLERFRQMMLTIGESVFEKNFCPHQYKKKKIVGDDEAERARKAFYNHQASQYENRRKRKN